MSSIELVVTDLDGTLWHTPDSVPRPTLDAVRDLEQRDVPLLVATGRRVASTREPLAAFGMAPAAVVLNGALGLDLSTGDRFHRGGFGADDATATLMAFLDAGIVPCVYVDDDEWPVVVGPSPSTHPGHLAGFATEVRHVSANEFAATAESSTVLAFGVLGIEATAADAVASAIQELATPHVGDDRQYGGTTITVAPKAKSKWDGIAAYCRLRGLSEDAVLVIGDGPNDVEMLANARVALVPADGHSSALALADHVVAPAADGGWAELLDHLTL